jgi:hypothetical protein
MEQHAAISPPRAALAMALALGSPVGVGVAGAASTPLPAQVAAVRDAAARKDAGTILRVTLEYLRSLDSFSADGESVGSPGTTHRFSMRLGRPGLYRITWATRVPAGRAGEPAVVPDDDIGDAVWNPGDGPYVYSSFRNAYVKAQDDPSVLSVEAGVSNGLTRGIPRVFLRLESWFADLASPTLDGIEDVEGESCWVISGPTRDTERRTLWISRDRLVIRRHRWSYTPPPEHADDQTAAMESAFERMKDGATTQEEGAQIAFMADLSRIGTKYRDILKGDRTETYRNISVNRPFDRSDFVVDVPEGTVLKASFDEFLHLDTHPQPSPEEHADGADGLAEQARAASDRRDAHAILRAMLERYQRLDALAVKGQILSEASMFGTQSSETTSFSVLAARPDRYRVTWSSERSLHAGDRTTPPAVATGQGAVWHAADGPYIYLSQLPGYASAKSDEVAFAMATGVSHGAALIASLLLQGDHVLTTIKDPTYDGEEHVDGEACYVISGSSTVSAKHTLWVSKSRMVLRRHRWSYARPADAPDPLEQVDEKTFAEALTQMGVEDTPEARRKMAMMAEMAKTFAKHRAIRGNVTETYRKVRLNPKVSDADFVFVPPAGTPNKRSLLDQSPGFPR